MCKSHIGGRPTGVFVHREEIEFKEEFLHVSNIFVIENALVFPMLRGII